MRFYNVKYPTQQTKNPNTTKVLEHLTKMSNPFKNVHRELKVNKNQFEPEFSRKMFFHMLKRSSEVKVFKETLLLCKKEFRK